MSFRLLGLAENFLGVAYYGVAGIVAALVVVAVLSRRHSLDAFPTVGSSSLLGSWGAGFKFPTNGVDIIQEGYEKYKSVPFKVADMYGWTVILSNRKHVEELLRAPEDELSLIEAASDRLNGRYMLGDVILVNAHCIGVVRSQLTRNIGLLYPGIRDEILTAFGDVLDLRDYEWKSVPALSAMQQIVCRTSNRLFVGLPLCRDPDWIDLNLHHSINIINAGLTIGLFPKFIRRLAACFFTTPSRDTMRGVKHIRPIFEERMKRLNEYGNKLSEMPNDLLSWFMEEAEGSELTVKSLTTRVLLVNLAAIHSISSSFTHALFYLAANSWCIQPLREEVEAIVEKEGWSKAALDKMHKVDSFLKECQRMEGISALSLMRKALKDFTFSDGTCIPQGTTISVPSRSLHYDDKFYKNAHVFEPFRFARMQEDHDGGEDGKQRFVSTAFEYQPFGHGKRACPGRFLVATEMKSMIAHIVTTYDIKLEDSTTHPRSLHFGSWTLPNPCAKVLFRRRVD